MEPTKHTLCDLFLQLGLPDGFAEIESFIAENKPIPSGVSIHEAQFWSAHQADFLRRAITEDADWAVLVDTLNTRLR